MRVSLGLTIVLAVGAIHWGHPDRSLSIQAPAAYRTELQSIATEYEHSKPGVKILLDGTQANADLVVSQGPGPRRFGLDRLVIVCRPDEEKISTVAHLAMPMKLATVTDVEPLASGISNLLISAGARYGKDWSANVQVNLVEHPKTASEAVQMVRDSAADATIVMATDAAGSGLRTISIPPELADPISLSIALSRPKDRRLAEAFVKWLFTRKTQSKLEKLGISSPLRPTTSIAIVRSGSLTQLFTSALDTLPRAVAGKLTGASLRELLRLDQGNVTFYGADGQMLKTTVAHVRSKGGVLIAMGDGNVQVVIPGLEPLRWLRKIEIR
jgi:hypothetical protein